VTARGPSIVETTSTIDEQLITELLRLDGSAQAVTRTATHDHIVSNATIHGGETALVALAAANRDPTVFSESDQLRTDRAE
jgi:cytochrome P450